MFDSNIKIHFAGSDGEEIFYAALSAAQTNYRLYSCYKYIKGKSVDADFTLPADHVIRVQDATNRHVIQDSGLSLGGINLALSGGAITYAVTFLCTDIIGEIWGKETAKKAVKYGFIGQLFATACIMLTGWCPGTDPAMDNAYNMLLGQNWVFVTGSLCAYYVSQTWDVIVFHKIRDWYIKKHGSTKGGRWIWNNGSTMTSQIWDTVIYATISFGLGLGWLWSPQGRADLVGIMIGQYLLKACLALLDTPFFYFFTRKPRQQ